MRLFLDANVLFTAAHNRQGKAAFVLEKGREGYWDVVTSTYALEEARRNLSRKFPEALARLELLVSAVSLAHHKGPAPFPYGLAEKDRPIFQAAWVSRASHLLTGDLRDFGPFMDQPDRTHGICIQTVAEFLRSAPR